MPSLRRVRLLSCLPLLLALGSGCGDSSSSPGTQTRSTVTTSTTAPRVTPRRQVAPQGITPARPAPRPAVPAPAPEPVDAEARSQRMTVLLNQARAEPRRCGSESFAAAPPVTPQRQLLAAAVGHAGSMARYDYMSHTGRDGSTLRDRVEAQGYVFRSIGENVAAGQRSEREVIDGWLSSPGHCSNMMKPDFTQVGIARADNPAGKYGVYWAMVLGRPR